MTDSPTENDTKITDVDVSTQEGSEAGSPSADEGVRAESPTADEGSNKGTFLDHLKKAVDASAKEKSPSSEVGKEGEDGQAEAKQESEAADDQPFTKDERDKLFTKEELNRLHSKTRKSISRFLKTIDHLEKDVETHKPAAEQYRGIVSFLKDNDLSMDDANTAFDMMRNVVKNPAKALEQLRPLVQKLEQITGEKMPDELSEQVNAGYLAEEHAREISRHRADMMRRQVEEKQQAEAHERRRAEEAKQVAEGIQSTISSWESSWAKSDPDYLKKRDEVRDQIELELARAQRAGKFLKSTDEALALVEKCKKQVEAKYNRFQQPKQEVRHVTGSSAIATKTKPNSLAAAIAQAVNG